MTPASAARVSRAGLVRGAPKALRTAGYLAVVALSAFAAYVWLGSAADNDFFGFDFKGTLWEPAKSILDGDPVYPEPSLAEVDVGNPALYPPLLMLLVTPLTLLPWSVASILWAVLLLGAVAAALWILRVRDPICYGLALVSAPVIAGVAWGNVTLLLVPVVALAWRWRGNWLRAGVVVGVAIAAKLFLWPLLLWLLGTRRYKAAGAAAVVGAAAIFVPWAVIGFDGLREYPDLLRVAEDVFATHGFSVATMAAALGASTSVASWTALGAGVALGVVAWFAGRRGADEVSISIAVVAAILGSPIVWEYYYALVLVPLAIARPRRSWPWALLVVFYFTHRLPRPRLTADDLLPGGSACCRPEAVPPVSWIFNHAPPGLWPALGGALLACAIVAAALLPYLRGASRAGRTA